MKKTPAKIALLLFGSGMAALVYQTAWERMLRLVFGASTAASSAVLAIFLGGLGLGGAWLGRRAERSERPLSLYANLETLVAASAAITPFSIGWIARAYWALGGRDALGPVGATLVRLGLAALVLGPPVVLMGGTLPAAVRAAESEGDVARGRAAVLYAMNTLGAVAGALFGTFLLFELFGARLSLWIAALVNLLVAMLARQLGRTAPKIESQPHADDAPDSAAGAPARASIVYASAAIVGFAFLGLEVVWYRVLGPVLGGSTFTFGLILALALAGIGAGSFVYASRREERPASLSLLALTAGLEALAVALPLVFGDDLALTAAYFRSMGALGFGGLVLGWATIAAVVVLPAAFVSGYQFPVLLALLGRGRRDVARQLGLTYAFNTLGSIVGALIVGFVVLPRIGAVGTWRAIAATLAVLAVALLAAEIHAKGRSAVAKAALVVVPALLGLLCLRADGPGVVTRHTPIGAGRIDLVDVNKNGLRQWVLSVQDQFYWEKDGVESSVGVLKDDGIAFLVNGKSDGAVLSDRGTQALLGMLPAILHPNPKRAFVLGLGTGMTAGWLSGVSGMDRVDVAELEPAVVEVARECAAANNHVLERPNVSLFLGDGREFLLTHDARYDIIVSEPSNPYRAGVASLFTKEFYEVAKRRLAPGGYFAQWLQAYDIDTRTFRIVLATLYSVFGHVEAWQTQAGDFVMIASEQPREYDVDQIRRRTAEEPYRTVLPRAGLIQDAEGVLARFNAGDSLLEPAAHAFDVPINNDDTMVLEYAFARSVGSGSAGLASTLLSLTVSRGMARPSVRGRVDWSWVDEQRIRGWLVRVDRPRNFPWTDTAARARGTGLLVGCAGDLGAALRAWRRQDRSEPRDVVETYVLGGALAQAHEDAALEMAGRLEQSGFVAEGHVVRARYQIAGGRAEAAADELLAAVVALRSRSMGLCDTAPAAISLLPVVTRGHADLKRRAVDTLLAEPLAVFAQDPLRRHTAQALAFEVGDPELCVRALGKNLEVPLWQRSYLASRADCLKAAGHPWASRAEADLADWLSASPGDLSAGIELPPVQRRTVEPAPEEDAGAESE